MELLARVHGQTTWKLTYNSNAVAFNATWLSILEDHLISYFVTLSATLALSAFIYLNFVYSQITICLRNHVWWALKIWKILC
jgi:hypothetical protein